MYCLESLLSAFPNPYYADALFQAEHLFACFGLSTYQRLFSVTLINPPAVSATPYFASALIYAARLQFCNMPLDERRKFLRQVILLHGRSVVVFFIFHICHEQIKQRKFEPLLFVCRFVLLLEKQNNFFILPFCFNGVLRTEPTAIEHHIVKAIQPRNILQVRFYDRHVIEDEEDSELRFFSK